MADGEVTWNGITLGGVSSYVIKDVTGWDERPPVTDLSQARVRGHGDHAGDLFSQGRIVTVSGSIVDQQALSALALALQAATPVSNGFGPLTVERYGRALTAQARVLQSSVPPGDAYQAGVAPFAIQWRCADPLRYGPQRTAATALPSPGAGLSYPIAYPLNYGAAATLGQMLLANEGTADAPIVFTVSGSMPFGFELSAVGRRITYPQPVFVGQPVTVDTGAGTVTVEGTADRRSSLTNADWLVVPGGTSLTVQFTSLGGTASGLAQAFYQPAYW